MDREEITVGDGRCRAVTRPICASRVCRQASANTKNNSRRPIPTTSWSPSVRGTGSHGMTSVTPTNHWDLRSSYRNNISEGHQRRADLPGSPAYKVRKSVKHNQHNDSVCSRNLHRAHSHTRTYLGFQPQCIAPSFMTCSFRSEFNTQCRYDWMIKSKRGKNGSRRECPTAIKCR